MRKVTSYKCPECNMKYKSLSTWANHLRRNHPGVIPDGFSDARYFYYIQTGRTSGSCVQCKRPTDWNEETGKYNRYCNDPKCKQEYVKIAKKRMVDKYGKVHLLNDPNKQREMLQNRKISGVYTFRDGGKVGYVGSYEKDFLITCDHVLGLKSSDIISPSPHNYVYMYEGKPHIYIPDYFIPNLNLEIEVKDGGDNPNNHWKIQEVDKVKESLKDQAMLKNPSVNYFKVVNKDYKDFYNFLLNCKGAIDDDKLKEVQEKIAMESAEGIVDRNLDPIQDSVMTGYSPIVTYDGYSGGQLVSASESPSKIDPNFKAKGHLNLSRFRVVKINKAFLDKYKDRYSHLLDGVPPSSEKEVSVAWLDENGGIVAGVCVKYPDPNISDDYKHGNLIRCLEVSNEYRGYGLSKQVLDYAVKKLKGNALYVMSDNKVAMKVYEDYGFKSTPAGKIKVKYGKGSYYQMTLTGAEPAKESVATESVLFNKKDSYYNLSNWKTGKENNILFICGHSGSGKSTLGREIANKYNAIFIELDEYLRGQYCEPRWNPHASNTREDIILKEFYSHSEFNFLRSNMTNVSFWNLSNKILAWLYRYANAHPGELFVWEGVAIHNFMEFEFLKDKPVIIKGTSMLSSKMRAQKRDGAYGTSTINEYRPEEKRINDMRKYMNKNASVSNDIDSCIHITESAMEGCVSLSNAITQTYNGKKYYPLYIVLMANISILGNGIRAVTGEPYSHSSISFDASMTDLYTFGNKVIKKGEYTRHEFGTAREAFKHDSFKFSYPPYTPSDIYVMFFNERQIKAMKRRVEEIFEHHDQYHYNISGLIKYAFGKASKDPHKMFCSQFVAMILNEGKKGILTRDASLYSPYGITELRSIQLVDKCTIGTYDQKRVERKTKQIFDRIVRSGNLSALESSDNFFENNNIAMESATDVDISNLTCFTIESVSTFKEGQSYGFNTPKELVGWMRKNVKYKEFNKLLSPDEVYKLKYGSCHDQAAFICKCLTDMGYNAKRLFSIAYKPSVSEGGMTHTYAYYVDPESKQIVWIENAWDGMKGIHIYDNMKDFKADIKKAYSRIPDSKNFPELEFKAATGIKTGMDLNTYVSTILS